MGSFWSSISRRHGACANLRDRPSDGRCFSNRKQRIAVRNPFPCRSLSGIFGGNFMLHGLTNPSSLFLFSRPSFDPHFRTIQRPVVLELMELNNALYFLPSRCGPCRFIAPHFEQLAEQNPDVIFIKVDVDEADDVAQQQQVQAMPTFKFFKNGGEVKSFAGADLEKLKTCVAELK